MSGAEWGISAFEALAIMERADGEVLVRDSNTCRRPVHPGRLIEVTRSRGKIHGKGGAGVWYSLDAMKPAAGKSRDLVVAMREKKKEIKSGAGESTEGKEKTMPPEIAPRPKQETHVQVAAVPIATKVFEPGSFTLAASRIEGAIREVDARRADLASADRDLEAAKELVRTAFEALQDAENVAKKLANEFNALVAKATA